MNASNYILPEYNLDWSNGKVYGKDIPKDIVERKFRLFQMFIEECLTARGAVITTHLWDYNIKDPEHAEIETKVIDGFFSDISQTLTDNEQMILGYLIKDPAIFRYAFLRWENKPIRLRYYQDAIACDQCRFIDSECSNQSGKSFELCSTAADDFSRSHGKNWTIMLVSRNRDLNANNMMMIKQMLKNSNIKTELESDSATVLVRQTSDGHFNRIVCSVAGLGGVAYAADRVLMDEFEFWKEDGTISLMYYHDQIFMQRTNYTKGQIRIASNPNGENFVSQDLHKRGGELQYHVYNINYLDVPGNSEQTWNDRKKYMHPIIFASTMGAERAQSQGSALTPADILSTKDTRLDELGFRGLDPSDNKWFLDLGFVYDQSVIVACYLTKDANSNIIYNFPVFVYPQAHPHSQMWGIEPSEYPSVPELVNRFGGRNAIFELDLTGKEGNEVIANNAGLRCVGIKMSGPWKAKWYDRFVTLVKLGRIRVQNVENYIDSANKNFEYQAQSLKITTKSKNGRNLPYPLYHHTSEKDHDDILDAIVGCLCLADQELTDGDSYDMYMADGSQDKPKVDVLPFEDYIKTVDVPKFINIEDLRVWYNKRNGLV